MKKVDCDAIENPFLADETAKTRKYKKKKKVVFVVAEPNEKIKNPKILQILDQDDDIILLHNRFEYENEAGQKTLKLLNSKTTLPKPDHAWEKMMRQEIWGIKHANLVIFDLDTVDSFHLMSVAAAFDKPIVCVSDTLKPVPIYFSGSILGVFKADQIDLIWKITKQAKKQPKKVGKVTKKDSASTNITKEKIQQVLTHHFKNKNGDNTSIGPHI